jgi:NADP-dependent 3-hydroxy acid dehydrogenase YdfG
LVATAQLLAKNNYRIILCGRRDDRLKELEEELAAITDVHCLQFDVRDKTEYLKPLIAYKKFSTIDIN